MPKGEGGADSYHNSLLLLRGLGGILGLYGGDIGIMEKKMETTIMGFLSKFICYNPLVIALIFSSPALNAKP